MPSRTWFYNNCAFNTLRDLTAHALVAAEMLSAKGIDARVVDYHPLKPLNVEMVLQAAE